MRHDEEGRRHGGTPRVWRAIGALALCAVSLLDVQAQGQTSASMTAAMPAIFRDADLALGERLLKEQDCSGCHMRKVGGDGSAIYRPSGRINTPGALRGMVDLCSNELKIGWFPEEVTAVAAILQRDHYRFPASVVPR